MFSASKTAAPSGYNIQRSVRLRASASAYFSRTLTTPTNANIWTWSGWIKRGTLGGNVSLIGVVNGSADTNNIVVRILSDQFSMVGGTTSWRVSTQVFRDPSAWYHLVISVDTTQATANNRILIYVNGVQITAFGTLNNPTQNTPIAINTASAPMQIGAYNTANFYDGYLTEVNFIDGQALTPTSFGAFNATTGVWQPIRYSGTYGTNGFFLNFLDNSGATATTIGKDSSGNGNNWTPNNISVTAGVTYDSMTDVPTLTSPTQANFCTFNPLITSALISNANLTTSSNGSMSGVCGTMSLLNGKYYFELSPTSIGTSSHYGIIQQSPSAAQLSTSANSESVAYRNDGNIYRNTGSGFVLNQTVASFTTTDLMAAAVDTINLTVQFYKNNTAVGTPVSLTSGVEYTPWIVFGSTACVTSINFGQRPFSYTPPTGFNRLNTYNLPTPTIPNGAAQFAATTYTGTGSSLTIANTVNTVNFQPDFVWVKGRSGATDHALYDSVRGTTKDLVSNSTAAETTQATGLTAFGSTGFTVGTLAKMNTNAATYVAWQWKASGTTVSNTSGSITSTVSVNTTAGFSIVGFNSGAAGNKTVGHGLGVAPSFWIIKTRNAINSWSVGTRAFANPQNTYVSLNLTAAGTGGDTRIWANAAPTSSVLSFESGYSLVSNTDCIAYLFAEIAGYSKFGSYTGNGAADGPFVYTGFRPRFVCVKRSDGVGGWTILDSSRDTYNVAGNYLFAETSAAEGSTPLEDFLSNGFKLRATSSSVNSVGTYIYFAFAENPFNYSLAR